jgi:CheY-like chemotaxis protein
VKADAGEPVGARVPRRLSRPRRRQSTVLDGRVLRREDYWLFVTDDAAAAARVASVSAIDLVLVDVALGRLEGGAAGAATPGRSLPRAPALTDGYAVLRPLQLDPASARFPVVTLKTDDLPVEPPPACRFAVVEFLPRPWNAGGLLEGLEAIFRETVQPAEPVEPGAHVEIEAPRAHATGPGNGGPQPFGSTPAALRTALVVDPADGERRALVEDLVRHGFTVLEATNGADALRLAVARRPWLVLTELLPDQSGLAPREGCAATASCAARPSSSSPRRTTARPAARR